MSEDRALLNEAKLISDRLHEQGLDIQVGDLIIGDWYYGSTVTGFKVYIYPREDVLHYTVSVLTAHADGRTHSIETDYFVPNRGGQAKYYALRGTTLEDLERAAITELSAPTRASTIDVTTTAITNPSTTEMMHVMADVLDEQRRNQLVLRAVIEHKLAIMNALYSELNDKLTYMQRVINLLETFMGVYQEAVQISDGDAAPIDTPITVRQLVLYMDEVVADIEYHHNQPGIDFQSVDLFDAWLARPENLDEVAPEPRCIVALKPSRQHRHYSEDWLVNAWMNNDNKKVYLVIRNGAKVWRIYTAMEMGDLLFPTEAVMEKIYAKLDDERLNTRQTLEVRNEELNWKQHALLLEGILQRTDYLWPLKRSVSLFNPQDFADGLVTMIRDAENAISDGHLPFKQWRAAENAKIKRGSRILYTGVERSSYRSDRDWQSEYFGGRYVNNYPSMPPAGVYTVEEVVETPDRYANNGVSRRLRFLYMPADNVYYGDRWGEDRQNRVSFWLNLNDDANSFINYDTPLLSDINAYIGNRLERKNYLDVMTTLIHLRKVREQEREHEAGLVRLMAGRLGVTEAAVWDAVNWWKFKVIDHRYIADDENKAWRMIEKRVRKGVE